MDDHSFRLGDHCRYPTQSIVQHSATGSIPLTKAKPKTTASKLQSHPAPNHRLLFGVTFAVALAEWLMFELLRTPYAPPSELTLLGTEKYGLVGFMICVAIVWLIYTATALCVGRMTIRDLMLFVGLICAIMAFYSFILNNPMRFVSSWDAMWM